MLDVTGQDVAAYLGRGDDTELVALAGQHVLIVAAMARAYTRGQGFESDGEPKADVAAVITTATARMVVNPEQTKRYQVGDYSEAPAVFQGWTLAELFVLNSYRKRAA